MGGGEHRGQRIEQGGPAPFRDRMSLWCVEVFVGQDEFRYRTLLEKVQRDDGFLARCRTGGPGKDQFFVGNDLQVRADDGTAILQLETEGPAYPRFERPHGQAQASGSQPLFQRLWRDPGAKHPRA